MNNAERNMWKSYEEYNISEYCFQFINRLSSFFFSLARFIAGDNEITRSMYDKNNFIFYLNIKYLINNSFTTNIFDKIMIKICF